jgi:hypothetical protein
MHERSNDYDGADRAQLLSSILCGIVAAIMLLSSLAPGESRFNAELTIVSTAGIMFILGVILFFPSFGWRSQTRY